MIRHTSPAAILFAGLLLASVSPLALAAPAVSAATGSATTVGAGPEWAQAHSDLAPDPAVRFGVLPNGMRYAIMRNATPAGQTSLRLRVGSGSLEESDDEQGLAHVLEHMAFRGSKNVPADEMIKILQRKGLAFGPDTNAETEWTQTVYMLDLPKSDPDTLETGLMLMRETAGNLNIDAGKLAIEKGVVLSEERLRDTPEYRAEKAQADLVLHGQLAARRFPIGTVEVVKNAPASLVRKFYEANYRPERTTLIAVGDFDPADMERRIKALFSNWKPVGPPTAEPDLGAVEQRGRVVRLIPAPGASTREVVSWVRPYDASPDTAAKERSETVENLALAILNRRLSKLAQGENPPFLSAGAAFENLFHSAKIAGVEAVSPPDKWNTALETVEREVRRLVAFGVTQAELDREIVESRATLKNAVAGAPTRPTAALASSLVDTVNNDEVFTSPQSDLAVFDSAVKDLTADTVDAAVRRIFAGAGPLVAVSTPETIPGGEAAVAAVFDKAASEPLTAQAAQADVVWPYASFGPPGKVVEQGVIPDLGVTTARFANGVRLTVKPTDFRKDQVLISVDVGEGRLELPTDRSAHEWTAGAFINGGFGKISFEDSQRALAGKLYSTNFAIGNDAFQFRGDTRPEDLGTQLQVITAYLADPGYRAAALERARAGLLAELPQLDSTPAGVFGREAGGLLTRGDARFSFPSETDLKSATTDDLKALLAGPLAHGRIEITIVGDITPERAMALVGETFGALPARDPAPPAPPARELEVRFPDPTPSPLLRTDKGRPDQAVAVAAWPAPDFYADMKRSRAIMLASEILGNRLVEKLRFAQGGTYSPQTQSDLSQVYPGYGYVLNLVEMPPPLIPAFFDTVRATAADLAATGPTPDELERARNPHVAGLKKAQLTNEYWIADLTGAQGDPRHLALIRTTFPDYEAITAADIKAAARDVFKDDAAWRMVVKAQDAPAKAP